VAAAIALIVATAAILMAVAVVAATAVQSRDRNQQRQQEAQNQARAMADAVAERLRTRRDSLNAIAASAAVEQALASGDSKAIATLAERYAVAFPKARGLLIATPGGIDAQPEGNPPISYALVELVSRTVSGTNVEMHRPGQRDAQLTMVASVRREGALSGHVVGLFPASVLTSELALSSVRGWELAQVSDGETATIARAGVETDGHPTVSARLPEAPWRVRVIPDEAEGLVTGHAATRILTTLIGGSIIIALVAFLVGRRLTRAIRHDGSQFQRLVTDVASGRVGDSYAAASPELEPALIKAYALARESLTRSSRALGPGSGAGPTATDAVAEQTEPGEAATANAEADELGADAPSEEDPAAMASVSLDEPLEFTTPEGPKTNRETRPATIDPSILRAYDIRGVVGETLTPEVMRSLGQALGSEAADQDQPTVVVGYDGRQSSPELAEALIAGLQRAGRDVIDIGAVATPVLYFATHHLKTGAGVMVTGSHNPPAYNGLKMIIGGETLSGNAVQALGGRLEAGNLVAGEGRREAHDVSAAYRQALTSGVTIKGSPRVAIDCGNGIAGAIAPALFRELGCEVWELFCEVDGAFSNHHPDPAVADNLESLIAAVKSSEADLGIAFDGDGDRLGVVDDTGKIIWADRQLMLFARDVLASHPGSDVVFDVKCTNRLPEVIMDSAGIPVMWKTGHSMIKAKLAETNAPLGGEMSGHFFFNDRWYGFDDALYAGARLLEILGGEQRPASAVFADLPEGLATPELRVDLQEGEPPAIIDALIAGSETLGATRIATIDGLRVDFPDGWGLVRSSNTQPCLVMRFEGDDEAALERIQGLMRERLAAIRPGIRLPF